VPSRRATLAALLAAAGPAGCLSGGVTGDGSDSGTPAATPTDRRTPTPTPTPEVTEIPALYGPQSLAPPTLGDPDAEVTVAVYEDFRCPHCHDYHAETFDRLREEYIDEGTVRYEHHDFPVINENSFQIAVAGDAVGYDAGDDAFWEFAAAVFGRGYRTHWGLEDLLDVAAAAGADRSYVHAALVHEEPYYALLRDEKQRLKAEGIDRHRPFG